MPTLEPERHWTPLMRAVALGSVHDVRLELDAGAALEAADRLHRTAFALALLMGDLAKIDLLFSRGANADVVSRVAPPLFYAIDGHHPHVVKWLLEAGAEANQADSSGVTALMHAAEQDAASCVDVLLTAGADVHRDVFGTALNRGRSRAVVERLLAAGADPAALSAEGRHAVVGLPPDPEVSLLRATADDFRRASSRRFGRTNPEAMNEPFWLAMIRSGIDAYGAGQTFGLSRATQSEPVWCARRFGQTLTFLPDGRIVQIAGEHEDYYDPDFCIYNDVFVHAPDGAIDIFGYPESVFPPTDFHTATLAAGAIVVIGSLGYQGRRLYGETPVFTLDPATFRIARLETGGDAPGWIYGHRADLVSPHEILIRGGTVVALRDGKEVHEPNRDEFVLDLERRTWRRHATMRR